MGVWSDGMLRQACEVGKLVDPYDPLLLNPASIDLLLGGQHRRAHPFWGTFTGNDPLELTSLSEIPLWGEPVDLLRGESFWIMPGEFILCHSLETVNIPIDACAFLYSKSSTSRKGLEHLHAGYGDPGFSGQWTWELHNVSPAPVRLWVGEPLMQMVLMQMATQPERSYAITGRYMDQVGATPAR